MKPEDEDEENKELPEDLFLPEDDEDEDEDFDYDTYPEKKE